MIESYIDLKDNLKCCGCVACVDACPLGAISMQLGSDGAVYPLVDTNKCVSCGKCHKVCPMSAISNKEKLFEPKAYVAYLTDKEKRNQSASGGAFWGLVEGLKKQYPDIIIVGAVWETPTTVSHKLCRGDETAALKKSKYVQSDASGIYRQVKESLNSGETVLFSGTPCQIAALKNFLGKDYNKLYTVDIICHGVPGKGILESYLAEIEKKYASKVKNVCFRYKKKNIYGEIHSDYLRIELENGKVLCGNKKTDSYLRGFHRGLFYRESCYSCPYANPSRNGDITLGDYWSIQKLFPELIDYTGVSSVLINTEKGQNLFECCEGLEVKETKVEFLLNHNSQLMHPSKLHSKRTVFFDKLENNTFSFAIAETVGKPQYLKNFISGLVPRRLRKLLSRRS